MQQKYKIGVIGGGVNSTIGYAHFLAIDISGKFKVSSGYFSRNKYHNKLSHKKYALEYKNYRNLDDYLKEENLNIDVFLLITETHSHFEILKKLKKYKKPIICEKPSVGNFKEFKIFKKILNKEKKIFFPTYVYLGYPIIKDIREILRKNKIGKIHEISLCMPQQALTNKRIQKVKDWRKKDKEIPTLHLDLVVHLLSILKFLFPRIKIRKINSKNLKIKKLTHTSLFWLETNNDMFVDVYASKYSLGDRNSLSIDIKGSNGRLRWQHIKPEILEYYNNLGTLSFYDRASPSLKISRNELYNRYSAGHPYGFIEAICNYYLDIFKSLKTGNNNIFNIDDEYFIFDILNRSIKGK
tara:strand:- start:9870 stop:10931 length:1062 start_codon:yes stop_codon:yes gene_type:complete